MSRLCNAHSRAWLPRAAARVHLATGTIRVDFIPAPSCRSLCLIPPTPAVRVHFLPTYGDCNELGDASLACSVLAVPALGEIAPGSLPSAFQAVCEQTLNKQYTFGFGWGLVRGDCQIRSLILLSFYVPSCALSRKQELLKLHTAFVIKMNPPPSSGGEGWLCGSLASALPWK